MQRSAVTSWMLAAVLTIGGGAAWLLFVDGAPAPAPGPPIPEPAPPPVTPSNVQVPATGPRVSVDVQAIETFVPPPVPRVEAVQLGGGSLSVAPIAGEGAGPAAGEPRAGLALAAIAIDGGHRLLRQVAVPAEGAVRLEVGGRVVITGHVLDEAATPVRGARVWAGEMDAEGGRREATTGDDGGFELDVPAGEGVPLVAGAEGRASSWQAVAVSTDSRQFRIVLQPASTLDVQIAAVADGIGDMRLFVVPHGPLSTELAAWPFFAQVLTGGFPVAANGRASVTDLPRGASIGLIVVHPRAAGGAPHGIVLRAANERTVLPVQLADAAWRGRVVDEEGASLAGVSVWSRSVRQSLDGVAPARFLPPHLGAPGCFAGHTDGDGAFALGAAAAPDAVLSLRSEGRAGRDLAWSAAAAEPVTLPAWRGGSPEFRLQPPQSATPWVGEANLAGGIRSAVAADQPWVVSLPHAGRYRIVVTTFVGDQQRGRTELEDVVVTGPVELRSPRL